MKFDVEFKNRDGSVRIERIDVEGRHAIDFMASNAQGFLQLCKFVYDQAGEHRGMALGLPGSTIQFNYADGRLVTVREAVGDSDAEYRMLPRVVLPFQITVPAGILKKAGTDAVMLLRIGAAANALQTVLAQHAHVPEQRGLVNQRDLAHLSIIIASYIQEVAKIIYHDKSHAGRLWVLAERGIEKGRQLPHESLDECRALLAPNGPLIARLAEIRNLVGFHLLPPDFKKWLDAKAADDGIVLEAMPDPKRVDCVFVGSLQATAEACHQPDDPRFFADATRLAFTLPYVIEAAITGLLAEHGFDVGRFLAFDVEAVFIDRAKWDRELAPPSGPGVAPAHAG